MKIKVPNAPNRRYRNLPPLHRSGRILADWLLNLNKFCGWSNCYRWPRLWGSRCRTIFKFFDQTENMTPVLKCVKIEFPSVSHLKNIERLRSVISSFPGCRNHWLHLCRGVRLSQRVSYDPVGWGRRIHWLHLCWGIRLL